MNKRINGDSFGQQLNIEQVNSEIEFAGICLKETRGYRGAIYFNDGTKNTWLPKSIIKIVSDEEKAAHPGGPIIRAMTIMVPERIAQEKGLS